MTVIAAIKTESGVLMGADTCTSVGSRALQDPQGKLWRAGELLFGVAGDAVISQALRYGFLPPAVPDDVSEDAYMRLTLPDSLREYLAERGLVQTDDDDDAPYPYVRGEFLVGWRGRLWQIHNEFTVSEVVEPYNAIGSGGVVARTALHCLSGPPRERLTGALEVAAQYCEGVRAPFTYLES